MYLLIGFSNAVVMEAVILKASRNRVRVAIAGQPDSLELKRAGEEWLLETGERVTLEFLLSDAPETISDVPVMSSAAS
jgi:hypothetical protein